MTIQKAIRSGKPFRRKAWGRQFPVDWYIHPDHPTRDIHDILATDWEIKK